MLIVSIFSGLRVSENEQKYRVYFKRAYNTVQKKNIFLQYILYSDFQRVDFKLRLIIFKWNDITEVVATDTFARKKFYFSQNLALRQKFEFQSAHFSGKYYTLHCAITQPFEIKYHYHLSDYIKHGGVFIDHMLRDLIVSYNKYFNMAEEHTCITKERLKVVIRCHSL